MLIQLCFWAGSILIYTAKCQFFKLTVNTFLYFRSILICLLQKYINWYQKANNNWKRHFTSKPESFKAMHKKSLSFCSDFLMLYFGVAWDPD